MPSSKKQPTPDLSEALKLNSNKDVIQKLKGQDSLVNFSYQSKFSNSIFGGSSSQHTLIVKLFPYSDSKNISNSYLQTRSSEIKNILDKEMTTLPNFDDIDFKLISNKKEPHQLTLKI
ncbi:hypothetical protein [Mangrovimonas sp. TPBH4]|uniref:hypothetical protein n=1 Tax=Mangrovimonas sp. TPBH4 TaxID=1645914 RepID=UPI0006B44AEF|nr:hypothetical protein [Mangrovimonas sp. TPBH4]